MKQDVLSSAVIANAVARGSWEGENIDPYHWATSHCIMPDGSPYRILGPPFIQPYLREMYRSFGGLPRRGRIVVMKAAQMGWTEWAKNCAFWFMDKKREGVLYMLRTDGELGQFAQARLNPSIRDSPYIRRAFSDADNVALKIGWGQSFYLRGATATEKLREIPVGLVVRDEYEVMDPLGANQALARLGASENQYVIDLGNPRYPEAGIHADYLEGTQNEWQLSCRHCKTWAAPRWPDSINEEHPDSLVCPECGKPIKRLQTGRWVALNPRARYFSHHIAQFVNSRVRPVDLIEEWRAAKGDPTKEQLFYNLRLGLPYAPAGARLDWSVIKHLPSSGPMLMACDRDTVMGVDVGAVLHVVVRLVSGGIVWVGEVEWEQLDRLMGAYNVIACGMDAMPETHSAKLFGQRFPDQVVLIRYHSTPLSTATAEKVEDGVSIRTVPRTASLDAAFSLIHNGELAVPESLPPDFWEHFTCVTRHIVDDGKKRYATYIEDSGKPDHYAHAFNYSEIVREGGTFEEQTQVFL